jgi:ABC-type sugar transport system permease subunit
MGNWFVQSLTGQEYAMGIRQSLLKKGGYGSRRDILFFLLPGMGAYAFIMLYPNIYSIYLSLTEWHGYGSPEYIGFENFKQLINDPALLTALGMVARSLFLVIVITLPFAFIMAFLLSRKVRGARVYRFFYFLPLVVPGAMLGVMWRNFFLYKGVVNFSLSSLGLEALAIPWLSTIGVVQWVVLVPDIWGSVCFYILIFASGLAGIPQILYDAAEIDGASAWQQLIYITLPSMRAVYVTAIILALPGALSTFIFPFAMTQGGPVRQTYTLALWIFSNIYGVERDPNIGYGSAVSLIHAGLGIVLGLLVWRYGRRNVVVG